MSHQQKEKTKRENYTRQIILILLADLKTCNLFISCFTILLESAAN